MAKKQEPPIGGDIATLFYEAEAFLRKRGAISASYRFVPAYRSQLDSTGELFHFGFPDSWVELYDKNLAFRQHDPIADFIMGVGHYMSWKQAIAVQTLSPEQEEFVRQMTAHGLIDGIALPLYGPRGREAYSTYSFGREITPEDTDNIEKINAYAKKFHAEVVLMTERRWRSIVGLSKRENEVLMWIARGKSNTDIATILGVSPSTVITHVRRLYKKLDVNDRMTATLKGLQYGVVRI